METLAPVMTNTRYFVVNAGTKFRLENQQRGHHDQKLVVVVLSCGKRTNHLHLNEPLKASEVQLFDSLRVNEHRFFLRASAWFYDRHVVDQRISCNSTCGSYEYWGFERKC